MGHQLRKTIVPASGAGVTPRFIVVVHEYWQLQFAVAPAAALSRSGWRKTSLKKGDAVTVQYSPIRDGQKAGAFANVRLPDGSVLPGNRDACSKSGLKPIVPDTQGARQK